MDTIELIAEVLKYSVPALLVLLTVKFLSDNQVKKEQRNQGIQFKSELFQQHLPARMNAYERAILYLERIRPENMLLRVGTAGKNVQQLGMELLAEIRGEYEHNLSQQLYISNHSWLALVKAKEEMAHLINESGKELGPQAPGIELGAENTGENIRD